MPSPEDFAEARERLTKTITYNVRQRIKLLPGGMDLLSQALGTKSAGLGVKLSKGVKTLSTLSDLALALCETPSALIQPPPDPAARPPELSCQVPLITVSRRHEVGKYLLDARRPPVFPFKTVSVRYPLLGGWPDAAVVIEMPAALERLAPRDLVVASWVRPSDYPLVEGSLLAWVAGDSLMALGRCAKLPADTRAAWRLTYLISSSLL